MRLSFSVAIIALSTSRITAGASIQGRVVDQSLAPVAAAEVRIHKPSSPALLADLDTDSAGKFLGPELPTGDYVVEVSKPNFMALKLRVHGADYLTVHLARYGTITGRVSNASTGQPVTGARLMTLQVQPGGTMQKFNKVNAVSDPRGQFRLFGLPVGRYCVAVSFDGSASDTGSDLRLFPNDSSPQIFEITAGEEFHDVNFFLTAQKLYRISGHIEGPPSETGFGATLIARSRPYISIAQLRTERDGKFVFEGIPAGSYDIVVAGPVRGWGSREVLVEGDALFGRTGVELSGQDVENLAIPVANGRSVTLSPSSSNPSCGGGQLSLTAAQDQGVMNPAPLPAKINQPIKISNLPPGRYHVKFSSTAHDCYQLKPILVDTEADAQTPTPVLVGAAGSISGKITGVTPPSQLQVSVLDLSGDTNETLSVVPDDQARFAFDALPPGSYRITLHSSQAPNAKVSLIVKLEAASPLHVDLVSPATEGAKP